MGPLLLVIALERCFGKACCFLFALLIQLGGKKQHRRHMKPSGEAAEDFKLGIGTVTALSLSELS